MFLGIKHLLNVNSNSVCDFILLSFVSFVIVPRRKPFFSSQVFEPKKRQINTENKQCYTVDSRFADTSLLRSGAEVLGIITENTTRCHGLSLSRTSNLGPNSVRYSETVHCLATVS